MIPKSRPRRARGEAQLNSWRELVSTISPEMGLRLTGHGRLLL